jgi:hypothetical protein
MTPTLTEPRSGGYNMSNGFSISDFKAHREHFGVAHTHSYTFSFAEAPPAMVEFREKFNEIQIICDSTNFPGLTLDTYNVQYYGYGPAVKRPTIPDMAPLQATFVDDQMNNFFYMFSMWQRNVINYFGDSGRNSPQAPYELRYLSEYATDIRLKMWNPVGQQIREVVFREAYPIMVGDVQYSWGRLNEVVKVPVVFAYTDWRDDDELSSTPTK